MKRILVFCVLMALFLGFEMKVSADNVDYRISQYYGKLTLHEDYTAGFEEKVTYQFDDDYNGQYVSLYLGGNLPKSVGLIKEGIKVSAETNHQPVPLNYELLEEDKQYQVKVYNSGKRGDTVVLTVSWPLKKLLMPYQDVSVLNWKPITNWDVPLDHVLFDVEVPSETDSQLKAHTGYFKKAPKISKIGNSYRIDAGQVDKTLELHAYWDNSIFLETENKVAKNGKSHYLEVEQRIQKNTRLARQWFQCIVPIGLCVLMVLGIIIYLIYYLKVTEEERQLQKGRLYENPEELTPLQVSQNIFNVSLIEAGLSMSKHAQLKFKNMLMATLLDIVHRGNIQIEIVSEDVLFKVISDEGLSYYEQDVLELAFGNNTECYGKDLFSHVTLAKSHQKSPLKNEKYIEKMSSSFRAIDRGVLSSLDERGLKNIWRKPNSAEKNLYFLSLFLLGGVGVIAFAAFIYLLSEFDHAEPGYWLLIILSVLSCYMISQYNHLKKGVLTKEGALRYQYWTAFRRMINEINTFSKAELESIVIWDKLLVYATLFGAAKSVLQTIKLHDIKVDMGYHADIYLVQSILYTSLNQSIGTYSNALYHSVVNQLSASSSSNGGFSSGGFSGGGGGGGGGAF